MSVYKYAYNVIGTLGGAITLPVWLPYVLCRGKYRKSFLKRLGLISPEVRARLQGKPVIWVHAVSVGEVGIAQTLISALRPVYPSYRFVLSVTTLTGHAVACKGKDPDDEVLFFPVEFYPLMARMVQIVNPRLILIAETELWPNFIYAASHKNIPIVMINGRISQTSYKRYALTGPFIRDVIRRVSLFLMQTADDATRIEALGAPASCVRAVGNIKFDAVTAATSRQPDEELLGVLQMPKDTRVFLAAALEKTGREDALACDILQSLRAIDATAAMILVPRHPERGKEVAACVAQYGWSPRLRSQGALFDNPLKQVYIVDTVGELRRFYTLADVVYVGKSIFPPGGGQNMIEPIATGCATVYGRHTSNFRGIADRLAQCGGACRVKTPAELVETVCRLWTDSALRHSLCEKGLEYIRAQNGVTAVHVDAIRALLPPDACEATRS